MINLKLIDQPILLVHQLSHVTYFLNRLLEMWLGLLTFYFGSPRGSQKIFLDSSLASAYKNQVCLAFETIQKERTIKISKFAEFVRNLWKINRDHVI